MGKPKSFARSSKPRFKLQPRVLILCEDTRSALTYLKDAAIHFRSFALVEVAHCGRTDPRGIVEEAIRRRKAFEAVYCVIDEDAHESFQESLRLAKRADPPIQVIPSYPCYEFWLLLHFRFSRQPVRAAGRQSAGDRMLKMLRKEPGMAAYDKGDSDQMFAKLLPRLPRARIHAEKVMAAALAEAAMNPSTALHDLIDELERLGEPRPVNE